MLYVNTAVMPVELKYRYISFICVQKIVGFAQYVSMLYG